MSVHLKKYVSIIFVSFLLSLTYAIEAATAPVAVVPFKSSNKRGGEQLAAGILVNLYNTRQFTIVERGELKKALAEIARSQSGIVRDEDIMQIGRQVGAKYLILGDLRVRESRAGKLYNASMRIIKTETGIVIGAASSKGRMQKIIKELSDEIINALSIYFSLQNPGSPYTILLKLDKGKNPVYKIGEKIVLNFKVIRHRRSFPSRVHIKIYSINSLGAMTLLYPNKFSRRKTININKNYSFPPEAEDFEWILVKPTGTESIQAIVTTKAVDFFGEKNKYLKKVLPLIRKEAGNNPVIYRGIEIRLKKKKMNDWAAERVSYILQ